MNDNDYSDFVGFGQSPRYVAMPAWYKAEDKEKKKEENSGNASEGWKMGQGGNMAPAVVNEQVEVKQPEISAPAGNAVGTGQVNVQPVAARTDIGGSMQNMNEMAVKQSAGGGFSDIWKSGFDAPFRGKRTDNGGVDQTGGTGITDPDAVVSMGSEGGNASEEWKVGQSGSMMPKMVQDPAGIGEVEKPEVLDDPKYAKLGGYRLNVGNGEEDNGQQTTDNGLGETEAGSGDYPQTWDEFMKKMKEMDENYRKGENRRNWWELMTRGLVGAANLYGTTKGAPALDLSDSKEAFSNKDAYARLKDEKQTMYNVVNKEIERRQKAEAAALKAKDAEYRWKKIDEKIKQDEKEWGLKEDEYKAKIKTLETKNETEEAKALKTKYEAEAKKFETEHQNDLYDLRVSREQSIIAKNEAAAYKSYNGGSGSNSSSNAAKKKWLNDEFTSSVAALASYSDAKNIKDPQTAKRYVKQHKENKKLKKLMEDYDKKINAL